MTGAEAIAGKVLEATATQIITKASPKVLSNISSRMSKEMMRLKVSFTKTFQGHLIKSFERSQNLKTVISRDKPVILEQIYVPLTLRSGQQKHLPDTDADPTAIHGRRLVISGTGGAGKTILMKHLLNLSISNRLGMIPIFIELRNIEFDKGESLEECIFYEISKTGEDGSFDLFRIALEEGLFALYLDGFDEIHPNEAKMALKLISTFSKRYQKSSIIISSRPQTGVSTLQDYTIFHVESLNKRSAVLLIEKTEYDEIRAPRTMRLRTGVDRLGGIRQALAPISSYSVV